MNKKPRIAFCFSWQARTLDQTYPFIKTNIIDAAKEQWFDYDIFCVVEDDEDCYKVNLLNPIITEKIKSRDLDDIINIKLGKRYKNELIFSSNYFKDIMNKVHNQIYKIQRSLELKTKFEEKNMINYDFVLRLRYDTYFCNKLNFNHILHDVYKKDCVICNRVPNFSSIRAIQDFYFIRSWKWAKKIEKDLFDEFDSFYDKFINIKFLSIEIISRITAFLYHIIHVIFKKDFLFIEKKIVLWLCWPELLRYKFYLWKGFIITKTNISFVLQRKNNKEWCIFHKTKYEF